MAPGSPTDKLALEWCDACHFWRPHPCGQCPPRRVPQETNRAIAGPAPDVGPAPEPTQEDRPCAVLTALADEAPSANAALQPPPPPIDVDASQGTATELADLMGDDADGLSPPGVSQQPADTSDEDPGPPAKGPPKGPLGDMGQHESRLAALVADTALEEVNPCRAMDVDVFIDRERLSAVGRRMCAAGQEATPVPGPHSPESDGLSPLLAQYAKQTRELLQLMDFTLGVPSFSLSSWEGDAILAPHPPGLGITVYYVIEGKVELRLPTPNGNTRPGWWLQAMAYAYA